MYFLVVDVAVFESHRQRQAREFTVLENSVHATSQRHQTDALFKRTVPGPRRRC